MLLLFLLPKLHSTPFTGLSLDVTAFPSPLVPRLDVSFTFSRA